MSGGGGGGRKRRRRRRKRRRRRRRRRRTTIRKLKGTTQYSLLRVGDPQLIIMKTSGNGIIMIIL